MSSSPAFHIARDGAQAIDIGPLHGAVVAIGDSMRTDLKGAHTLGVDFLFVTAGIHAEELGGRDKPDASALKNAFTAAGDMPKAVMRQLTW